MIEKVVLSNLINNENFARKILPFLSIDYFSDNTEKIIFELTKDFIEKYNKLPNKTSLIIDLENKKDLNESLFKSSKSYIEDLNYEENINFDWLVLNTEKFCQDKALYLAIMKSIKIMDEKTNQSISRGSIPKILSDALAVSFDEHIGHDFIEDSNKRYDFYHTVEKRIPFDIDFLNLITNGGLPQKSLNVILGGVGVGKTLVMCHLASANLLKGYNVLYITLEMAEERIAERIDSNLLDIELKNMRDVDLDSYQNRINKLKKKTPGKLIIKEYPTACASTGHFRHLLNELKIKKNFIPDIIYIDYLNICSSSRLKQGANVNLYSYIKAIAEEIRGLSVEYCLPIVTATQLTRTGIKNSDPEMTDTSESIGLPAACDLLVAIVSTDELNLLNQFMFKQLKNRYNDIMSNKKFYVGVDRSRMRLYNVEQSAQEGEEKEDKPIMDKGGFDFDKLLPDDDVKIKTYKGWT